MKPEEVLSFFKSAYRFSLVCEMSSSSLLNWSKRGFIPYVSQKKIEKVTRGMLKSVWDDRELDYQMVKKAHGGKNGSRISG